MWYILHKAEMDKLHIKCKIDSIFQDDDKIKDSAISLNENLFHGY